MSVEAAGSTERGYTWEQVMMLRGYPPEMIAAMKARREAKMYNWSTPRRQKKTS